MKKLIILSFVIITFTSGLFADDIYIKNQRVNILRDNKPDNEEKIKYNWKVLPLSISTFWIAFDYQTKINDLNDIIEEMEKPGLVDHKLLRKYKDNRDHQILIKNGLIAIGVVNLFLGFETVSFEPINNGVSLSFKF